MWPGREGIRAGRVRALIGPDHRGSTPARPGTRGRFPAWCHRTPAGEGPEGVGREGGGF